MLPQCRPRRSQLVLVSVSSPISSPSSLVYNLRRSRGFRNKFDAFALLRYTANAGWSSLVARRAHNPKVVSSNLTPATNFSCRIIYLQTAAAPAAVCISVQLGTIRPITGKVKPIPSCPAISARHLESSHDLS